MATIYCSLYLPISFIGSPFIGFLLHGHFIVLLGINTAKTWCILARVYLPEDLLRGLAQGARFLLRSEYSRGAYSAALSTFLKQTVLSMKDVRDWKKITEQHTMHREDEETCQKKQKSVEHIGTKGRGMRALSSIPASDVEQGHTWREAGAHLVPQRQFMRNVSTGWSATCREGRWRVAVVVAGSGQWQHGSVQQE
ncbi:hypothetical protein B0H14DRAFT_2626566 [Mycena olivaceomarginata]|nr:hypothetical protein B0H14DRAFT_2626566 [Mycena olivaceomarginata]